MATNGETVKQKQETFAQLPRSSIRNFAEFASFHDLEENIYSRLAQDSNYWLRETIKNAVKFMKQARRKKLTAEDFNKGSHGADNEHLFGYNDPKPFTYKKSEEGNKCHVIVDDAKDNFGKIHLHDYEVSSLCHLGGSWLSVGGFESSKSELKADSNSSTKSGGTNLAIDSANENYLSYYRVITKAIAGYEEESLFSMALKDLKTNPNVSPLLSHFENIVAQGVKKMNHNLALLKRLLLTVESLNTNESLFMGHKSVLANVIQSLLVCVTEPLTASLNNDQWIIRDSASYLIASLLHEWTTQTDDDVYRNTLINLECIFQDLKKPFYSHYGVIAVAVAIGVSAIEEIIVPHLPNYWKHLNAALESDKSANAEIRLDADKVHGMLLNACELLLRSRLKEQFQLPLMELECSVAETEHLSSVPVKICEPMDVTMESAANKSKAIDVPESKKATGSVNESEPMDISFNSSPSKNSAIDIGSKKLQKSLPVFELYQQFYEQFGDALTARLPYLNVRNWYKYSDKITFKMFTCPELHMNDEELLEKFNKVDEEVSKSKPISKISLDEADLEIKSISETKLIIRNKKRSNKSKKRIPLKEEKFKKKELEELSLPFEKTTLPQEKPVLQLEKPSLPLFEVSPIIRPASISINVKDGSARPLSELKGRKFETVSKQDTNSQVYKLSKNLKKICKRKIVGKKLKNIQRTLLLTGNMKSVL